MNMHSHEYIQLIQSALTCLSIICGFWIGSPVRRNVRCPSGVIQQLAITSSSKTRNLWLPPFPLLCYIATRLILNKLLKDMRNMLGKQKNHRLNRVSKYQLLTHTELCLSQAVNRFPQHLPNKTIYQVLRLLSFNFIRKLFNMQR